MIKLIWRDGDSAHVDSADAVRATRNLSDGSVIRVTYADADPVVAELLGDYLFETGHETPNTIEALLDGAWTVQHIYYGE